MTLSLYKKELCRILKSLIFLLIAVGTILFAYTQGVFPPDSNITKPEPQSKSYGMTASRSPELIMPEAAKSLFSQSLTNQYTTYPNGFIKNVKLSESKHEKMSEIIAELSSDKIPITDFKLNPDITWERFSELMEEADSLLGGGSDFSTAWISHRFGQIPVTYEEALADYELTVSYDKITGAHARLFCDYMGCILGILPTFLSVFLCLRDRKNIVPMLYTRRISAVQFILARYLALISAIMIPVSIMCAVLTGIHMSNYGFMNIDVFAYLKYALFWLLPTVMVTTAVGVFFTTLTNTPIAIALQLVWWFVDMIGGSGAYSFFGVSPLTLIPRHNQLGNTTAYIDYLPRLIQNRILIALIAVLLVCLSIFVFSVKRKGLLHVPMFRRGKV